MAANRRLACAALIVLGYLAMQRLWLPADGFFSGDGGTKYLQARAVVMHGPLRPWVEGPSLDVDTAFQWQEPFLRPRGEHLVGEFPWLFPALTAPFLWVFGLRGLFVVPAASAAGVFLAASAMGRRLGQPFGGIWSGLCALVATPVLFYGAELWEHAPAVAFTTAGGALLTGTDPLRRRDGVLAAIAFAIAFAFRPEAILLAPAFLVARAATSGARTLAADARALLPGALGAAVAIAVMNVAVYGTVVPYHVSSNVAVGFSSLGLRGQAIASMLWPRAYGWMFAAGAAVVAAAAFVPAQGARRWTARVGVVLMLIAGVAVPLGRTWFERIPWLDAADMLSLAHTWPLLPALALYLSARGPRGAERVLLLATVLGLVFILVSVPHAGGAQWSARFLLPVMPLGAVLAIELVRRRDTRILAATALVLSVGLQVYGLRLLHHFKSINSRIAHATAILTKPGDIVVSDLFWYPQVTATLYPTRRLLFARRREDIDAIAVAAADRSFGSLWIVTVTPATGYTPPASLPAGAGRPPFVKTVIRDPGVGSLTFHRFVR